MTETKARGNNGTCAPATPTVTRRGLLRLLLGAGIVAAGGVMPATLMAPEAAYATTQEQDDVLALAKDIRGQIQAAQGAYYEALARREGAETQRQAAEAELATVEEQLASEQGKLGAMLRGSYTSNNRFQQFANIITTSDSLDEMIEGLAYYQNLTNRQTESVRSVKQLQADKQAAIDEIDEQIAEYERQSELETQRQEELQAKLTELQPQINEISDAVTEEALSTDKASALQPILSYLTSVSDVTETQQRILTSAMQLTSYSGPSLCENWTRRVYQNAGFNVQGYASAYADYLANGKYDLSQARPGALLFGAGQTPIYNHVMIVVSVAFEDDGVTVDHEKSLCIDNELARAGRVATWAELEAGFNPTSHGPTSMWACGTYPGVDLGF